MFAVAATVVCAVLPAVAFSATAPRFLGFGGDLTPNLARATLRVSAQLPHGRVVHLWTAPSTPGGTCLFVTYESASAAPKPTGTFFGGRCSFGREPPQGKLTWSFSTGSNAAPPVIQGQVAHSLHPTRVELRWRGGSLALPSKDGYFVGDAAVLANPPFRRLPYDLVAVDGRGEVSYRTRIPTSFLYRYWKRVQPRLHAYRLAHGCSQTVVWSCRSR